MAIPDPIPDDGDRLEGVGFVRVADPRRFRHYRTRRAPWVKLGEVLTTDARFRALPDAAKAHAVLLILRLARCEVFGRGVLPDDSRILTDAIGATEPVDVDGLVRAGILERLPADDLTLPDRFARGAE